jgi:hypothetical protein
MANRRDSEDVLRVFRTRAQVRAFYHKVSRVYDLLSERSEAPMRKAGLRLLEVARGERLLELGFGTGHSLVALVVNAAFASLFVPFYFFRAGLELSIDDFSLAALATGLGCVVLVIPLRLALVGGHRSVRLRERVAQALRVGVPLLPTTVFTLVVIDILRERFAVPPFVLGGLVVYMLANTLLPSLLLRTPPVEFAEELEGSIAIPRSGGGPSR